MEYRSVWKNKYKRIQAGRSRMWQALLQSEVNAEWLIKRPKENLWAIDEIIRHLLASEIRYIHQSFKPETQQIPESVPAQWVGNVFFRLEERDHIELKRLKEIADSIEDETMKLLDSSTETYEQLTQAPWGEEMKVFELLESYYDHENYHRGQVLFILNFFRGIPKEVEEKIKKF
jgi:uncharacterized damage-inducible protein DinB